MFYKRSSSKDGHQSICKVCRKEIDADSYKSSSKRREAILSRNDVTLCYNRKLARRYKRLCGCKICGIKEPVVLDLHHLDPSVKEDNPSNLYKYSTRKLKIEIRKCAVLCSNCHRMVHAGIIAL